jgi:adenylate cyclase
MGADEEGTLARLKAHRRDLVEPKINGNHGRIVKTTGDGMLVEFVSVIDALRCAIEVQGGMRERNCEVEPEKRIVLRIGINFGDIVVEGDDIYGDGVNVAARLEELAEPGGIYVSARVQEDARGKLDLSFEDLGDQRLKNIAWPVRVYRLRSPGGAKPVGRTPPNPAAGDRPGRPSIAVLPFVSLGGDAEQRHLADGISEDIITELARYTSLFVIARNSSFLFRDQPVDIRRTGRDLGARYLVEGSLRRLGPQIRIAAQLIEVETGGHLWAERYDRKIGDLFALQDEVVRAIVVAVADRIDREEERRLATPSENWLAYDHVLYARQILAGETYLAGEAPLRRAIELDPGIAEAHALLVYVLLYKYWFTDKREHLEEALTSAQRATELNSEGSGPCFALALVNSFLGQYEFAGLHFERAIALNPNNYQARIAQAQWLVWGGKGEEALAALDSSVPKVSLGPRYYWEARGEILFQLRRYDEAIEALTKLDRGRYFWVQAFIVAALAQAGRVEEARDQLTVLHREQPDVTIARMLKAAVYKDERMRSHLIEGLRKAGMPER